MPSSEIRWRELESKSKKESGWVARYNPVASKARRKLDRLCTSARLKRLLRTADEQAETGPLLFALAQQPVFLPDALVVFEQRLFVAG